MDVLGLVPIYCGTRADLLTPLADRLAQVFGLTVEQIPAGFDPQRAFDDSRGQYNSRVLLAQLERSASAEIVKVLGVAGVDLFIPVLTYVFGEAQLDSRAAVVSTYRLDNALYGLPSDADLLFNRLCKESIHELGHTFGLVHCADGRCVMASSPQLTGVDLKSARFCADCLDALRRRRSRPPRAGS